MFRKIASVVVGASLLVGLLGACAGNQTGTSEGGGCSTQDECDADLTCTPVSGRSGDFCCPAPLLYPDGTFVSSHTNCQPVPAK